MEYSQENKLDKITLVINTFKDRFHAPMGRFQLELINYFTYVGWDDCKKIGKPIN